MLISELYQSHRLVCRRLLQTSERFWSKLFPPFSNVKQVDSLRFPIFIHINTDTAVTQALFSETYLCKELELCFVNRKKPVRWAEGSVCKREEGREARECTSFCSSDLPQGEGGCWKEDKAGDHPSDTR